MNTTQDNDHRYSLQTLKREQLFLNPMTIISVAALTSFVLFCRFMNFNSKPFIFLSIVLLAVHIQTSAQKKYFQQETQYFIEVKLDDENHILRGFEQIKYKNNSDDTLKFIFMHLWPNAYKNDRTAFCKQQVEDGKKDFYFSDADDKGFIDSLRFQVGDNPVNVSYYNNYEDVILLELVEPILPHSQTTITTPFRLVIPKMCSRLGHIDQDYEISQWYPKPAVYDVNGWHPMPYLDQGEFYSEFGSFDVSITLPKPYWVAATGLLQNEEEKERIEDRLKRNDSSVSSGSGLKTLQYKQDRVHDFAWFASKEFMIEKQLCELPSKHKVACYAFFKPSHYKLFHNSAEIVSKTIQSYSMHVGEYAYDMVTIVDAATVEGAGGMEYPMVTNIGKVNSKSELQTVIIHEVGHNWFYGMLGSNERDLPWMDEGVNSFYEDKVKKEMKKDTSTRLERSINIATNMFGRKFMSDLSVVTRTNQPLNLPAPLYTSMNYGSMIYNRTPYLFTYLESYLGSEVFKTAMKHYFNVWKFRHPQPEDFKKCFEESSGKNLSWFFDELWSMTHPIDFKIKKVVQNNVFVKNRTSFKGPVPVSSFLGDSLIETKWLEYPFETPATFTTSGITSYRIQSDQQWIDDNPKNSFFKSGGLFHRYKLKIRPGIQLSSKEHHAISLMYAMGYNHYNQFMLGGVLHNLQLPNSRFQYALTPLYSLGTKSMVGNGFLSYTLFPKKYLEKIILAAEGKTFHNDESHLNIQNSIYTRFYKLSPQVIFTLKPTGARSKVTRRAMAKLYFIGSEEFRYNLNTFDSLYRPAISPGNNTFYAQVKYSHENKRTFNPFDYSFQVHGNQQFMKASAEGQIKIDYHFHNKAFYARVFTGKFFFLGNDNNRSGLRAQYLASTHTAANDYLFNETYLARNEQKGFLSQQVDQQAGGMKFRSILLSNPIGMSDNWLMSVNLRSDLPIKKKWKIQAFLDVATYSNAAVNNPSGDKLIYCGGVEWHTFGGLLDIYIPLLLSKDLKTYSQSTYSNNRLLHNITFSLNTSKINWFESQKLLNKLL